MAIKFGTDGTIYCNSVRYNYKQVRNIVYNNCACMQSSFDGWTCTDINKVNIFCSSSRGATGEFEFKQTSNPMTIQQCFTPTANHKYYGGLYFETKNYSSFTTSDSRFEWWCNDTDTGKLVFAQKTVDTKGYYVLLSSIQETGSTVAEGNWYIRNFLTNPSAVTASTKLIIVDLTEAFGSGNEPTKAWCDANILEYKKITGLSESTVDDQYATARVAECGVSNWNTLTNSFYPRNRLYTIKCLSSMKDSVLGFSKNISADTSLQYYVSVDVGYRNSFTVGETYFTLNFPSNTSTPVYINSINPASPVSLNGGGGLTRFKRISGVTPILSSLSSASSTNDTNYHLDFHVMKNATYDGYYQYFYVFNQCIIALGRYSSLNITEHYGGSAKVPFNTNTYDSIFNGRTDSIIHIKDPKKCFIKFRLPVKEVLPTEQDELRYTNTEIIKLLGEKVSFTVENGYSYSVEQPVCVIIYDVTNSRQVQLLGQPWTLAPNQATVRIYGYGADTTRDATARGSSIWQSCAGYDIECNAIEIDPTRTSISFDSTGTIKCSRLITNF